MIPSRTDEELKQLAKDIQAGLVFTDRHVEDPSMLPHVFMIFMFYDEAGREKLREDPPGLVYEYLSEAGPRTVNGLPSFLSVRMLNRADTEKVLELVKKVQAALDAI